MSEKIVLIGGGGHSRVVMDAITCRGEYGIAGIVDPALSVESKVHGVPVLGSDEILSELFSGGTRNAFVSLGSIGDPSERKRLAGMAKEIGFKLPVIIHPETVIAQDVKIAEGTFIAPSVTINTGSVIGRNTIINTSASIDHDCVIGDFVHIAPGVVLCGGVKVPENVHVGPGVIIIQNINIVPGAFLKAGTVVTKDIDE